MEAYKKIINRIFPLLLMFLLFSGISLAQSGKINLFNKEYQIKNIGPKINTSANEYSFRVSSDGKWAFFTSNRLHSRNEYGDDDIWQTSKFDAEWSNPIVLAQPINYSTGDDFGGDGSVTITADGKEMIFASARDGGFGDVDLYSAKFVNGAWGNVLNLGPAINGSSFDSHPSISPDGKTLYFTSDRSGGHGGMDIWMSTRDEQGNWTKAVNLGSIINTGDNDSSPFISVDGTMLYFASDGHPGYGGYDIFVSKKSASGWSQPLNLGALVNTDYNERFPFVPASGDPLYFSSDKGGGSGGYDIYIGSEPPKKPNMLAGVITSSLDNKPLTAKLIFKDTETGKIISSLTTKTESGEYSLTLPKEKRIEIRAEADKHLSQIVKVEFTQDNSQELRKDIVLQRMRGNIAIGVTHSMPASNLNSKDPEIANFTGLILREIKLVESVPVLNYIFFDKGNPSFPKRYKIFKAPEDTVGFNESTIFGAELIQYYNILNVIGSRLKKYKNANIIVVGCNDNDGVEANDMQLSRNRANAVKDYFVNIWGIKPERIKVSARNLPDVPSPVGSEEGQAENRRVEIQCDVWEITRPITSFGQTDNELSPSKVSFQVNVSSDEGDPEWSVVINQKDKTVKRLPGQKSGKFNIEWNWKGDDNKLVSTDDLITYQGIAVNKFKEEARSEPRTISVKKITLTGKNAGTLTEKVVDKISLILFDFKKYDLSQQNKRVLNLIYEKIRPNSNVKIIGHTDIIGTDEANLDLSKRRDEAVFENIKKVKPNNEYFHTGIGKEEPLYSNFLPEGRFYNRTVQVIVETEKK